IDSDSQYLELTTSKKDVKDDTSSRWTQHVARHFEEYYYDGSGNVGACGTQFGSCKGALTKKRGYRDPTVDPITTAACTQLTASGEPVCVDYGFGYELFTGNRILEVRPVEMVNAGANPDAAQATHYTYDRAYALFPVEVHNELNQVVRRQFDLGTG